MFINRMFILGVLMVSGITATTTVVSALSRQSPQLAANFAGPTLDPDSETMAGLAQVADGAEEVFAAAPYRMPS